MHFLPDVWVECDECRGQRYMPEVLRVQFKGHSIADVLQMRVRDALVLCENIPRIRKRLQIMEDVGLGYMSLGQSSTTLSGGEAQRLKLAAELCRPDTGQTLYILDEPTTGLHLADIECLLAVLHRLVDAGNTMVVIEHNMDVIKTADHPHRLGARGRRSRRDARRRRCARKGCPEPAIAHWAHSRRRAAARQKGTASMSELHLPQRAFFEFSFRCLRREKPPKIDGNLRDWDDAERVPDLMAVDGHQPFASVYMAYDDSGLYFACEVKRKTTYKLNPLQPADGDSLELFIDTRDVKEHPRQPLLPSFLRLARR